LIALDVPESLHLRILDVDTKGGGNMATLQLAKWGNSLALRIPKPLAEDAQLREGDPVTVTIRGRGTLVIKAARRRYRLEQLVSRINARNRHEETDWGGPQGREVW
jgi:antitoxin MazE